jgi:O-antigen ligase
VFRVTAVALIIGLLIKDLSFVGDRYVTRTVVELASLLLGVYWLTTSASIVAIRRQVLPIAYLFVLLLSAVGSLEPGSVALQVLALTSVVLFAAAYFATTDPKVAITTVLVPALWTYALVLGGCLAYGKLAPTMAFVYEWGDPVPRFRGLFGEPAQLGIVAGLTLGLSVLVRTWWVVRIPAFGAAVVCVYLTYSRTFWIAVIAGLAATAWVYKPKLRIPLAVAAVVVVFTGVVFMDAIINSNERELRTDSLMSMSGRTAIWEVAMEAFKDRPLLGYGFTFGADGIMNTDVIQNLNDRSGGPIVGAPTLHNGYVQSMLDSGALGTILYCVIVIGAFVRLWWKDKRKHFAPVMYVLVFSMVGNIGETFIYGAAQSHQALYWLMAVFVLGLDGNDVRERRIATVKPARARDRWALVKPGVRQPVSRRLAG